jgi:signal transduction histidine kinase
MLTATTSVERLTDGIAPTRRPNRKVRGHERVGARSRARRGDHRASLAEAAVLQERARIARELHDSVSQTLYAITLSASRARSLLQRNASNEVQFVIDDLLQLASDGQTELRALLTDMRASAVTSGDLVSGLTNLAAEMRARNGLDVRLSHSDDANVPPAIGEALVMIAREALHNVVKHARAGCVDITVELDSREMRLTIADHGRGFDPAVPRPGHFGLQSMWERAAAVGGTLELSSAVGLGTRVRVRIPVQVDSDG